MTLFLIRVVMLIFYRLSVWLHTRFTSGLIFFRSRSGCTWLLDATDWRWLLRISFTRVVGGLLDDYQMHRRSFSSIDSSCTPYVFHALYNSESLKLCNKAAVCINWCRGRGYAPHFEKKRNITIDGCMALGIWQEIVSRCHSFWKSCTHHICVNQVSFPSYAHQTKELKCYGFG
jgi:hypothetical protein